MALRSVTIGSLFYKISFIFRQGKYMYIDKALQCAAVNYRIQCHVRNDHCQQTKEHSLHDTPIQTFTRMNIYRHTKADGKIRFQLSFIRITMCTFHILIDNEANTFIIISNRYITHQQWALSFMNHYDITYRVLQIQELSMASS